MKRSISVFCACAALAASSFGQSLQFSSFSKIGPEPGEFTISYTVAVSTMPRSTIRGAPYSGEEINQQTRTMADGNQVLQPGASAFVYRDSAGRVRTEQRPRQPIFVNSDTVELPVVPEICDPVAGYNYYLDPVNRMAHRILLPRGAIQIRLAPQKVAYTASTKTTADKAITSEPLGKKMLDGIEVHGMRTTTTYAAGSMGNDRPITATTELWTSPELGFTVYSKHSDPRTGDAVAAVINISREEPDPALFQIPPGYKIVDEENLPFTFTISSAAKK